MQPLELVCSYFKAEFGEHEVTQLRKNKSYQNRISYANRKLKDIENRILF